VNTILISGDCGLILKFGRTLEVQNFGRTCYQLRSTGRDFSEGS